MKSVNRVTDHACRALGYAYCSTETRADAVGNNQPHDFAWKIVGPNDVRKGFAGCLADIQRDIHKCEQKIRWDTCIGDCHKTANFKAAHDPECICRNVQLNAPIVFETTFWGAGHLLNGMQVFGVLLTGSSIVKKAIRK